ncbi:ABC transporter permease, partial [Kineosporia sp. R_H_3]|uniref:ABC transporter permease n=1 Tax=Kineosporia sp. R_H_3 TaxID=1961848 RepID=UPI00350FFD3E
MPRFDPRKTGLAVLAPVVALVVAAALSSVVLVVAGHSPALAFQRMWEYGTEPAQVVNILNKASGYFLSALAVAIGFRMNLFNIGVDGQYRIAAMAAAVVGATLTLPKPLHILVIVVVAVVVGALWAGIAGLLKVYRGVSEVISTIMLNFIGGAIVAWAVTPQVFAILENNVVRTRTIPESGWFPGFTWSGIPTGGSQTVVFGEIYGFIVISGLVGVLYWFVLSRTRFGFDLRATGSSEPAAVASGVDVKRMVLTSMLLSGAVAGLVGMPILLGAAHSFGSQDFPAGIGFTGIAIALLGRNNPVGIAFASVLWGFLDVSNQILDIESIPKEIVTIMQGAVVLAVVVAYEIVRRIGVATEQRRVMSTENAAPPAALGPGEDQGRQE